MALNSPQAAVADGNLLTAAYLNQNRDNVDWMAQAAPKASVTNSAVQSCANGVNTVLTFNTENFDVQNMHSTVTNTSRLTVPTGGAGKYLMGCAIQMAAPIGQGVVGIMVNGSFVAINYTNGIIGGSVSVLKQLAVGDYIECIVANYSGAAVNTLIGNGSPTLWATWMAL